MRFSIDTSTKTKEKPQLTIKMTSAITKKGKEGSSTPTCDSPRVLAKWKGTFSSKFRGVHYSKNLRKWVAKIYHAKQARYIGCFGTQEQAARAYDARALELKGKRATLNFPEEHKVKMEALREAAFGYRQQQTASFDLQGHQQCQRYRHCGLHPASSFFSRSAGTSGTRHLDPTVATAAGTAVPNTRRSSSNAGCSFVLI